MDRAMRFWGWRFAAGTALSLFGAGLAAACGGDDAASGSTHATGGTSSGGTSSGGASSGGQSGADAGGGAGAGGADAGCVRTPGPPDGPRKLVLGHPYDASGGPGTDFELFDLDASGTISASGTHFSLGRGLGGEIQFTPDGELGFSVNDDGSVGVFRLEPDGSVSVLEAALSGGFYASKLAMDPSGSRVWVLDDEWRDIGGGVYALEVGCDDQITVVGQVAPAKLPAGLAFTNTSGRALVAADDILSSPADQTLHLLDWSPSPSLVASLSAFSGDAPIVSVLALSHDDKYALVADDNQFSGSPNRIAVVGLDGDTLGVIQVLSPIEDPADIETSPFDDSALVSSAFGNAIVVLSYDSTNPAAPYSATPLAPNGAAPELPVDMTMIRSGSLSGRVFVSEVSAIRQVAFSKTGPPTDLGTFALGSGSEHIGGAIGVTP
jgi:hypothetical protein